MVDIGDAKLKVTADTRAAEGKLRAFGDNAQRMSGKFRKMGIAMVAVGAAIAGAMIKITMEYAKAGDEIAKMSKRTGIATETLSKWKFMADLSGTSLQAMEKGFKKLAMSISDAKDGLMTYTREFEKVNVDLKELEGLNPEEQFMKIARAVAAIEDPMQRASSAQKLFGRAGMELLPMLEGGAEGMRELTERAEEFATIFDAEAARAAEEFNDSITDLKGSLALMGAAIAKEVMPDIQKFIEGATKAVKSMGEWIDKNPVLVDALKALVVVLVGGGGLLIAFSMIQKAIMAVNIALVIMHSLTGVGLIKVIAGLAAAGGLIAAMNKLSQIPAGNLPKPPIKLPGMQFGGIVPGPIGQPVPIMAHGGEQFAGVGKSLGNTYQINIISEAFMGNESEARSFAQNILEYIREDQDRTVGALS